jgi:hypothetical protein
MCQLRSLYSGYAVPMIDSRQTILMYSRHLLYYSLGWDDRSMEIFGIFQNPHQFYRTVWYLPLEKSAKMAIKDKRTCSMRQNGPGSLQENSGEEEEGKVPGRDHEHAQAGNSPD